MSAAPLADEAAAPGRGLALLRSIGPAGIASAAVLVLAAFAAVFGPLLTPYDPTLPNLSLAWVGPVGGHCLGMTSRAATWHPGCWPVRSPRCSGHWLSS